MSAHNLPEIFTLPLFPLHAVLFPQFPLQLHIFEERYKVMINDCVARNAPFGVVLIREGAEVGAPAVPHEVGCLARILEVERLDDGHMNLIAITESRFRLLDTREAEQPYLIGRVQRVEDRPGSARNLTALIQEVIDLFQRYLTLLGEYVMLDLPELGLPEDATLLAFCVASIVMLPPLEKQRLLEMTDARARLQREARLLVGQIEELEAMRIRSATLPQDEERQDEERLDQQRLDQQRQNEEQQNEEQDLPSLIARAIEVQSGAWQRYRNAGRN